VGGGGGLKVQNKSRQQQLGMRALAPHLACTHCPPPTRSLL